MTDKKFDLLLNEISIAHAVYLDLLQKGQNEYKRRFGEFPSDVDDDFWIDSFEQSACGANLEQVTEHAKNRVKKR